MPGVHRLVVAAPAYVKDSDNPTMRDRVCVTPWSGYSSDWDTYNSWKFCFIGCCTVYRFERPSHLPRTAPHRRYSIIFIEGPKFEKLPPHPSHMLCTAHRMAGPHGETNE